MRAPSSAVPAPPDRRARGAVTPVGEGAAWGEGAPTSDRAWRGAGVPAILE